MASTVSLIAVVDRNRGIGKDNKLLFNLPDDLKHFKKITAGHTVVMGYKTYKSIGHALPDRRNIVLSTHIRLLHDAKICRDMDEALKAIKDDGEVFVIGGASIYEQFLPICDKIYLTVVDTETAADRFFPDYSDFNQVKILGEGENEELHYQFLELTKQ